MIDVLEKCTLAKRINHQSLINSQFSSALLISFTAPMVLKLTSLGGTGMSVVATLFLLVIWLSPASAIAQTGVTVSGVVEDESRGVILGAQVRLAGGETPRTTSTDEQGRFGFEGVTPGKYKLRAEAAGFEPQELEIMAGMESPGP